MGQETSSLPPKTLSERSLRGVADYILSGEARKIVVMIGAGLSTAAGIPDFRSPKTGLYANLQRFNLEDPTDIFDIDFFKKDPKPFYTLAEEIYPGKYKHTISHRFLSLLAKKGLLFQLFSQNVDCLERLAGVPDELLVEAHGSFYSQRCIQCKKEYPTEEFRDRVRRGEVVYCNAEGCEGSALVKPDITFFGEQLPRRFYERIHLPREADLIIVMGTSLQVGPFNMLPENVPTAIPRLLINRDQVGSFGSRSDDVIWLGDCDESVRKLAEELGWLEELEKDWVEAVGEEEAQIQRSGSRMVAEDEVSRLAEKIDHVHIEDEETDTNGLYSLHEEAEPDARRESLGSSSGDGGRAKFEGQGDALETKANGGSDRPKEASKVEASRGVQSAEGSEGIFMTVDTRTVVEPAEPLNENVKGLEGTKVGKEEKTETPTN
ncbi:DHS-like NAD/FAD-binding domain containing protein [Naviculisporaceae sp. PSN 640]